MSKNPEEMRTKAMLRSKRIFWMRRRVKCEGFRWTLAKHFKKKKKNNKWIRVA